MKILNSYYTATGNTKKIAFTIEKAATELDHEVDTIKIPIKEDIDFLEYDLIIMGSGVYHWLPGKPLMDYINKTCGAYRASGDMPRNARRRPDKKAITYCTYGGTHSGINEAYPTTLWMNQFFEHLGVEVIGSWHILGEFHGTWKHLSIGGRLGDVRNRPNESDLNDVFQMTQGALASFNEPTEADIR